MWSFLMRSGLSQYDGVDQGVNLLWFNSYLNSRVVWLNSYVNSRVVRLNSYVNSSSLIQTSFLLLTQTTKDYEILASSPHLRKLKCLCSPQLPDFRFLTELESLKIAVRQATGIPNSIQINFPPTIKKLTLFGTRLPWERMNVLGGLPKLESLKLLWKAFKGQVWNTSYDEFQELRFLKLEGLQLEHWTAWEEHFPKLQHLVLHKCDKLQNIPNELGEIPTMKVIEVHDCCFEARTSAANIEEEQRDNGNEDLKVIITKERNTESIRYQLSNS